MSMQGAVRGERTYRRLKPRPGHAGRSTTDHQIGRMHAATIDLVGEGGYRRLTATEIARVAGVSKRTFYEQFDGKEQCFLATYDLIVQHTVRAVLAARHREDGWAGRLEAGFDAFTREVAERPGAARLALVDIFDVGTAAEPRMRHTEGLFGALIAKSFARPQEPQMSAVLAQATFAGCARVARARLIAGREADLPERSAELTRWALSLCPDRADAARARHSRRSPGRSRRDDLGVPAPAVDPGELGDDERRMILRVAGLLAAEAGYRNLSVTGIRRAAGISRRSFESHFDGVEDCFLAAVEELVGRALAVSRQAFARAGDWPEAVAAAIAAICRCVASDPVLARLGFLEIEAAGSRAAGWRADYLSGLALLFRESAPIDQRPSELEAEASVAAAWALLRRHVTAAPAANLPRLAPTLTFVVLAPSIGAETATELIGTRREASADGRADAPLVPRTRPV